MHCQIAARSEEYGEWRFVVDPTAMIVAMIPTVECA